MSTGFFGLPPARKGGQRPRLKPKRKARVTIIVGIIAEDGIVVASDSQTTTEAGRKIIIPTKFEAVRFSNGYALVAQSGGATISQRVIEIIQDMATGMVMTDYRTVPDVAQKAMRKFMDEFRVQQGDCDWDKLQEIVEQCGGCVLMLAYYFQEKPYIYTINIQIGLANQCKLHHEAIGCGASLGSYLLAEYCDENMETDTATALSVLVVESVKAHDAFCGGPTRVGLLRKPAPIQADTKPKVGPRRRALSKGPVSILPDQDVKGIVGEIAKIENETKRDRVAKLQLGLKRLSEEKAAFFLGASLASVDYFAKSKS